MSQPYNSDAADKEVLPRTGYKNPPVAHRFQPGKSGNPSGRRNGPGPLKLALQKAAFAKTTIFSDPKSYTGIDALLQSRFNRAIRGDNRAAEQVLNLVANLLDCDEERAP